MTTLREAAQQALEALEWHYRQGHSNTLGGFRLKIDEKVLRELRAALAQQEEPVKPLFNATVVDDAHPNGIPLEQWIRQNRPVQRPQTLDEAMRLPRATAQAYENGYKAGETNERERIIQFLREMQRVVGDAHNHYGVAAVRIKEGI